MSGYLYFQEKNLSPGSGKNFFLYTYIKKSGQLWDNICLPA